MSFDENIVNVTHADGYNEYIAFEFENGYSAATYSTRIDDKTHIELRIYKTADTIDSTDKVITLSDFDALDTHLAIVKNKPTII